MLASAAVALVVAAAAFIVYTGHYALARAESSASAHTSFVARTIARQNLYASDFRRPVTPARRARLDRLFSHQVLIDGALRVKLYRSDKLVTYSSDHRLIGTRPDEDAVQAVFRKQTTASTAATGQKIDDAAAATGP